MEVDFYLPKKLKTWLRSIPDIPLDFKCDGCSGVSDKWMGINLFPACKQHDWCYYLGRHEILEPWERKYADKIFKRHTYYSLTRVRKRFTWKIYAWYFAHRRYWAVRLFAGKSFIEKRDEPDYVSE